MMPAVPPRRIIVCADDYGISDGVNRAIVTLIEKQRINATSIMVVAPAFTRASAQTLMDAASRQSCQLGLHLTLTAPFRPLTLHFRPLQSDMFLQLPTLLRASIMRWLDVELLKTEALAQLAAFTATFGRPPDYLDGHQHVQIFPVIRDAALEAMRLAAPQAWVRQCGGMPKRRSGRRDRKSLLLNVLSSGFRARAMRAGIRFNPAFAGAYDFSKPGEFGELFGTFLQQLPDGGLVMCHPGHVDAQLIALDPLTTQREREFEFFLSGRYLDLLTELNLALA